MRSLLHSSTYRTFLFRLQVGDTGSKSNHIIAQHEIRLIRFYTESHRIDDFHLFLFSGHSVYFLENKACYCILSAISRPTGKVVLTGKSSPVGKRFQPFLTFAGSDSGQRCQVHSAYHFPVFITVTLEISKPVIRIDIIFVRKVIGTFQTVATVGSHIHHHIIISVTLNQVIVIIKPARTIIMSSRITVHTDIVFFHFRDKLLQFADFILRERFRPTFYRSFHHLMIRNMSRLSFIIYHWITVQARWNESFIIVERAATIEIKQRIHILTGQSFCPGSST